MLSADRAQRVKTRQIAGAAEKEFAERATLPTAGENMASWVEGYWGMTMVLMRLKSAGHQDLLQAPRADVSPNRASPGTCHAARMSQEHSGLRYRVGTGGWSYGECIHTSHDGMSVSGL